MGSWYSGQVRPLIQCIPPCRRCIQQQDPGCPVCCVTSARLQYYWWEEVIMPDRWGLVYKVRTAFNVANFEGWMPRKTCFPLAQLCQIVPLKMQSYAVMFCSAFNQYKSVSPAPASWQGRKVVAGEAGRLLPIDRVQGHSSMHATAANVAAQGSQPVSGVADQEQALEREAVPIDAILGRQASLTRQESAIKAYTGMALPCLDLQFTCIWSRYIE